MVGCICLGSEPTVQKRNEKPLSASSEPGGSAMAVVESASREFGE